MYLARLMVCVLMAVGGEWFFVKRMERLPKPPDEPSPAMMMVRIVEPPPPPEPPLPEPPPPEPEPPKPVEAVKAKAPRVIKVLSAAPAAEPPPMPAPPGAKTTNAPEPGPPTMGISMESSSEGGGMTVATGTGGRATGRTGAQPAPNAPPGPGEAVPAYEVTRMPIPEGRCSGRYTDEARAAGTEGTVVLDVLVGADGHTSEITGRERARPRLDRSGGDRVEGLSLRPRRARRQAGRGPRARLQITFFLSGD